MEDIKRFRSFGKEPVYKITYYHTLYKREVSERTEEITFKSTGIEFNSAGHGTFISYEYLRKIELAEIVDYYAEASDCQRGL